MEERFSYIEDPTARQLTFALAKCMETQPLDKISTSAILKEAGVSRSTFYRHYTDKYDLINRNYEVLLRQSLGSIKSGLTYRESTDIIFNALKTDPEFFGNALASKEPESLRYYIYEQSVKIFEDFLQSCGVEVNTHYNRMLLRGYITGTLTLTVYWAEHGMKEDVRMMESLNYDLLPDVLKKTLFLHFSQ